ncbi:MAG: hypothetical protein IT320_06455 [Anaerolineae bacterium]|nr:hypothetical protein [Anaerolineae bacterium]
MFDHDPKRKTARHVQFGVLFVISTLVVGAIIYLAIELSWQQFLADLDPRDVFPGLGFVKTLWWMEGGGVSPVIGFLLTAIIWHLFVMPKRERKRVSKQKRKDDLFW